MPLNGESNTTPQVHVSASSLRRFGLPVMLASSNWKRNGNGPTMASGNRGDVCHGESLFPPVDRLMSSLHSSMTCARFGLFGWLPHVVLPVLARRSEERRVGREGGSLRWRETM